MKILLIQTAFIGDVILATALVESIAEVWPAARIDLLVRKGNEGLLANNPHLHRVWVWEKAHAKYRNWWRLKKTLKQENYELVLNLQRYASTGLLAVSLGASKVVGFAKNPFSFLYSHRLPHRIEPGVHEIMRNHALLSAVGNFPLKKPRLYPSKEAFAMATELSAGKPYVCMAPASVWFTKQWPESKWVALSNRLSANVTLFLLGSSADKPLCERIVRKSEHPRGINLAGQLSLLESAALMAGAKMNYVNDSAPLHLCSAMNAPVTAIFCSTVPEFGFGPLSEQAIIAQTREALSCRPCGLHGKRSCPRGHFRCSEIEVEAMTSIS